MMAVTDKIVKKIAERVACEGGKAYYVGGCVRDHIRGEESKDIDIEIYGIEQTVLKDLLADIGKVDDIGEPFGIYKLTEHGIDVALPRKERLTGSGHKDFAVQVDPFMSEKEAAIRRDFTINSVMMNILTKELVDEFGGVDDIQKGIIRHIKSSTFVEDPLRVLRAAQFAARLGYSIDNGTIDLCRKMNLSDLGGSLIMGEMGKALLESEKPSVFFEALKKMNQLSVWFPELEALIGVKQNPKHHAEGDVWVHTMMVLDEAVKFRESVNNPLGFMISVLTHDMGKAVCTNIVHGELHAYNHEIIGTPIAERFMNRITDRKDLVKYVLNMTELHMKPNTLAANNSSIKATNRLFDKSVDPEALICIAIADGKGKIATREYVSYDDFFKKRLALFREYMSRPYVTGQDLLDAGLMPGEDFSEGLLFAHKLRLAGIEKSNALKQTVSYINRMRSKKQ